MSDTPTESPADDAPVALDRDLVLELNFVPAWARRPPAAQPVLVRPHRPSGGRDSRERRAKTERPPRDGAPARARRDGRDDDRRPRRGPHSGPPQERPHLPSMHVRYLPDDRQLGILVRKMRASGRAYPLAELVALFLKNPDSCRVKLELSESEGDLYQCKRCGSVTFDRDRLMAHLLKAHMADAFDTDEREQEPPSGNFVCVARCGLSGTLLGPPNHNLYAETVDRVHRTLFPHLSPSAFRARIETLREPALIEQWREEARRETRYRRKGAAEETPPLRWSQAADAFLADAAPRLILKSRRATLPYAVARDCPDEGIRHVLELALQREARQPRDLTLAIRGALRHRDFHLFKAGAGIVFVTATPPAPLDPDHAIAAIREVLTHLREQPGCTRGQLVEALRPGVAATSAEAAAILTPLSWLTERGHIIEFFDGALSVPLASKRSGRPRA